MVLELSVEEGNSLTAEIQQAPSCPEDSRLKKGKPRALILKATNGDFEELMDLIKSKFPDVQILFVTTGPAESILRVTKIMPFELQNSAEQSLYSVE